MFIDNLVHETTRNAACVHMLNSVNTVLSGAFGNKLSIKPIEFV